MKNEKIPKSLYSNIPIPSITQKEKNKITNKSKDKLIIKQKIKNAINNKNKIQKNTNSKNNETYNKILIKNKTLSNINKSFSNKTPTLVKERKSLKINNLKMTENRNDKNIINTYTNKTTKAKMKIKTYNNINYSSIKPFNIKEKYYKTNNINIKDIFNNLINYFMTNKINILKYRINKSFIYNSKNKSNINILNRCNSTHLLLHFNYNNKNNIIDKKNTIIKNKKYMTQKSQKMPTRIYKKDESINSSFLIEQKNIFKNSKNKIQSIKNKITNKNLNMTLYTSFFKTKKNSKEKKSMSFYISHKNSNSNGIGIEINEKKENLKIVLEKKNFKKRLSFIQQHYLQNTVSTKNKIVSKNKDENKSKDKSKSLKKKRYSFINRNHMFKFDKLSKTKYNITTTKDNSIKKNKSSKKLKSQISEYSLIQNNNRKIFNGKIDDYLITKELGKGSYASVKLAVNKNNKNKYAIKIYPRESLIDPQKRNTINNEINILKQLDNINILKLYEIIDTPKNLYLVTEYINGISLLEIIKQDKNHFLEEKRAIKIFIQIVQGISYCQSKNICHRDIKLENILLVNDDVVKIIDFGFAVKASKENYQKLFCGTPSYMAPEIVNKEKYIAQYSDIWSLGVLFYAMLYGRFPFKAKTQEELFDKINEAEVVFPEDIEISEYTKDLIRKFFVVVPTQRMSLNEIINELNNIIDNLK